MSGEMDRFGWFISDSSVRSNLDWDRFCDIEMELPDIAIQQKYVNVYNAIIESKNIYLHKINNLLLNVCPVLIRGAMEEGRMI
jgi:type I restriction enzyme S subunit